MTVIIVPRTCYINVSDKQLTRPVSIDLYRIVGDVTTTLLGSKGSLFFLASQMFRLVQPFSGIYKGIYSLSGIRTHIK